LKQYLVESMESGMLPRREAFKLLFELANSWKQYKETPLLTLKLII
jgi:hypothetical protein